ncbi:leucine-rich repeat domain-containing protein [Candidatus Palauibacter sp.]|uniref:leucine-rich repeat domain-containing protein n=1 Tax=Candidatus Palauibacter sp. TaxID=3101350 RepID=UPI003AF2A57F
MRNRLRAQPSVVVLLAITTVFGCGDESVVDPPAAIAPLSESNPAFSAAQASDRDILVALYHATDGSNWTNSENWLMDATIGEWHGVEVDADGTVVSLDLQSNGLRGPIPPELGGLAHLEELRLSGNQLTSAPPELGRLAKLEVLSLEGNQLTWIPATLGRLERLKLLNLSINRLASVPRALGGLANLEELRLWANELTYVPLELGELGNLRALDLGENRLASLPPELGRLQRLRFLWLESNELTSLPEQLSALNSLWEVALEGNRLTSFPLAPGGFASLMILDLSSNELATFPWESGELGNLRVLELDGNRLTDIPPGLGRGASETRLASHAIELPSLSGRLSESDHPSSPALPSRAGSFASLDTLDLSSNELSGALPAGLLGLTGLTSLSLADNVGLEGALPFGLTALEGLEDLHTTGTNLCAPADLELLDWLDGVTRQRVARCGGGGAAAYLTQAVQSRGFPVPLVAGEPALLRVFVTAAQGAAVGMPPVRATFHRDGTVTHQVEIPGASDPIPAVIDEGSLSNSANAEIPGWVIQPDLEVVIEPDPAGTLDPALGVARRIPAAGRMAVDVRAMPVFEVTLVPFLWQQSPDASILETVAAMADDPEGHELFERTHLLLPVSEIDATAHGSVLTSTNDGFELLDEVEMIRVAEGGRGHYLAVMAPPTTPRGLNGAANGSGSWSSFSILNSEVIAHEFGHNRSLYHAPCGFPGGTDRYYPYGEGNIGAWGYDFDTGELVPPGRADFMSYCDPTWTSDYQFTNALRYRIETESGSILIAAADVAAATSGRTLLLWGGSDGVGAPRLRPSFFIDAPPALPEADGPWSLTGEDSGGTVLFSLSFAMAEFTDTDDERAGFSFAVPVTWTEELARITLQGPGGSTSLDRGTDLPMTILRDPATRQIRGILDGPPAQPAPPPDAAAAARREFQVLFSRGIPDPAEARR